MQVHLKAFYSDFKRLFYGILRPPLIKWGLSDI